MTRLEKIASLYVATFGQTPSPEELDSYVYADHIALESIASTMAQAEGAMAYPDTSEASVKAAFQNTFGYTNTEMDALVQKQGFQYWVAELEDNPFITEETLSIALLNGAAQTDQDKATAIVADAVAAYENDQGGTQDPADDGSQFVLTDGRDTMEGTDGDDTFIAEVGQNQDGSVANAFATGDVIEGGMGNDAIEATMINDNEVDGAGTPLFPRPITDSVEEISIDALEAVTLDADRLDGADHYISNNSRGDLTVNNVNILDSQITEDITVEMNSTQQNADMAVYFNESSLRSAPDEESGSSVISMRLADGSSETDPQAPLENIVLDLSFTQGTHTYEITDVEATDGTYAGMRDAIETALTNEGLTGFTVELGDTFNTFGNFDVDPEGQRIEIASETNEDFDNVEFTPSPKSGANSVVILADSETATKTATNTYKVTGDVVLDDVGRGSDGGELLVGSTSGSATSTGIQVFNVTVEKDSVLHDISTTNGTLEQINLTNGDVKGDFVLTNGDYENTYGDSLDNGTFIDGLESMTASDFEGDITLGRDADIMNLGELDADVSGDVTYNATMDDGFGHSVTTGGGDDTHTVSLENSSDLAIDMGNGANSLTLTETGGTSTADITGGSGVDTVNGGAVSITANTGNGDDVVYAENTGTNAVVTIDGSTAGDMQYLYGRSIKVTIDTDGDSAAFGSEGFESAIVDIAKPSGSYLTSQEDFNEAVVEAINEDATLSKIADASIVNGNVAVTYKVDGTQATDAVQVAFYGDDFAKLSTTAKNAMLTEYQEANNDSTLDMNALETDYDAEFGDDAGSTAATSTHLVTTGATVDTAAETTGGVSEQLATYELVLANDVAFDSTDTLTVDNGNGDDAVLFTADANGEGLSDVLADLSATVTLDSITYDVTTNGTDTITLTQQSPVASDYTAPDATLTANDVSGGGTATLGSTTATQSATQDGVADVPEVQTIDVSGATVAVGESLTFVIDGTDVVYTNDTAADLTGDNLEADIANTDFGGGAGVTNTINGEDYTFANAASTGDLTITQSAGSNIDPITAFEGTTTTWSGTNSVDTDNNNTVNGGAGDDVIVLSSDSTVADTVVYSGYNQGDDTLVHFETGLDKIDLSAYLTNTISASESEESQVDMGAAATGNGLALEANSVSLISFSTDLDDDTEDGEFAEFSASDLDTWLEEESNGVTTSEIADLYQDTAKSVIMVENDEAGAENENVGEYKIFEVSYDNTAAYVDADTDKDFTVKLIGTADVNDTSGIAETDIIA